MRANEKCGIPVCFCAFLLLVAYCNAQGCSSSCDLGLSKCNNIGYSIYVPSTGKVNADEANAASLISQANTNSSIPTSCLNTFYSFVCNALHPSCNGSIPTPILPCNQMCVKLNADCGAHQLSLPAAMRPWFNCTGVNATTGSPLYAPANQTCSSVTGVTSTCYNPLQNYGGTCMKYNASLLPKSGDLCLPYVTEYVYVTSSYSGTFATIDLVIGNQLDNVMKALPITPIECFQYMIGLYCRRSMPPCKKMPLPGYPNSQLIYGAAGCVDLCYKCNASCLDFFTASNLTRVTPNCTDPTLSYVQGPTYKWPIPNTNLSVDLTCDTDLFPPGALKTFVMPPVSSCPPGSGRKSQPGLHDAICDLACPDASYNMSEWHNLVIITQTGSSLSLICMAFLIFSYLIQYEKRQFPSVLHFMEFVATAMFAVTFLIGGRNPEKNVWCFDEGTYANQSNNTTCGVQGFFFIYFGLALAAWCAIIAFIMFYAIVLNKKINNLKPLTPFFYLFGWGLPLIFGIAALASNSIGYGAPLAWCFIQFKGFGMGAAETISMDYVFFYIPVGVLFLSILIMFWATVGKIIYIRKLKIEHSSVAKAGTRTFQAQVRVLIFIGIVFAICFTLFEWRFQIEAENQKVDGLGLLGLQWTYCKMKRYLGVQKGFEGSCPGDTNPARIDYPHTVFESFLLSGIGLLIFIGFGADFGIYRHWSKIIKLLIVKDYQSLKGLVVYGKDPFTSTGTTRSKTGTSNSKSSSNSGQGKTGASQSASSLEEGKSKSSLQESKSEDDVSLTPLDSDGNKKPKQVFAL